jgi:hypothetical protein
VTIVGGRRRFLAVSSVSLAALIYITIYLWWLGNERTGGWLLFVLYRPSLAPRRSVGVFAVAVVVVVVVESVGGTHRAHYLFHLKEKVVNL